ncbi:MAG: GNAT family acetyltransferase [Ilumatobacter sp.]|uniref:GNAT family acetyltransferase n=1 Tax=Ilumatobacter sp. TaxID=1967498 RepID=UPI002609B476|nr:GNAT family acetyltransferase [Ilumatobacter sp.]MDJ0768284.1 GNAT family acetyltransferase [Ilumatobacter sp.]
MAGPGGLLVRPFAPDDRPRLIELWERCGLTRSWNDPDRDIDRKLDVDGDGLLVGTVDDRLVASVMAGYDGHRGWINYLAVDPSAQGAGHGAAIMQAAEARLRALGCPKINLQIRTTNLDAIRFYESIGYSMDEVVSMSLRLVDDERR